MAEEGAAKPLGGGALEEKLELFGQELKRLEELDGSIAVGRAFTAIQSELAALLAQNRELGSYTEQALEQAEKLKRENEELRKSKEEAVADGLLAKKLSETEKLATASTAYKNNLLQQNIAKKDQEVQKAKDREEKANDRLHAAERQIKSLTSQLSEIRHAHREAIAELEELKDKKSTNAESQTDAATSVSPGKLPNISEGEPLQNLGDVHEALAARLLEGGVEKLDSATVAAAASGLRDTSVLEKQLKRARDENERLQKEIQQLNETVFSKSFKAPSAWAEREVKYKMEKRAWEQQLSTLKEQIKSLTEENTGYRESNKAAEFENQIKDLKKSVKTAEAEKTAAQQALHALQLQMRDVSATKALARQHELAPEDANVHNLISAMEEHGIGVQQPRMPTIKEGPRRSTSTSNPLYRADSDGNVEGFPVAGANLQELIEEYDDQGIGMAGPSSGRRLSQRKSRFSGVVDASAGETSDDNISIDMEGIKHGLKAGTASGQFGSDIEADYRAPRSTWSAESRPEALKQRPSGTLRPQAVNEVKQSSPSAADVRDGGPDFQRHRELFDESSGTDEQPVASQGSRRRDSFSHDRQVRDGLQARASDQNLGSPQRSTVTCGEPELRSRIPAPSPGSPGGQQRRSPSREGEGPPIGIPTRRSGKRGQSPECQSGSHSRSPIREGGVTQANRIAAQHGGKRGHNPGGQFERHGRSPVKDDGTRSRGIPTRRSGEAAYSPGGGEVERRSSRSPIRDDGDQAGIASGHSWQRDYSTGTQPTRHSRTPSREDGSNQIQSIPTRHSGEGEYSPGAESHSRSPIIGEGGAGITDMPSWRSREGAHGPHGPVEIRRTSDGEGIEFSTGIVTQTSGSKGSPREQTEQHRRASSGETQGLPTGIASQQRGLEGSPRGRSGGDGRSLSGGLYKSGISPQRSNASAEARRHDESGIDLSTRSSGRGGSPSPTRVSHQEGGGSVHPTGQIPSLHGNVAGHRQEVAHASPFEAVSPRGSPSSIGMSRQQDIHDRLVSEAVRSHGDYPTMPVKHSVQRDWETQGQPGSTDDLFPDITARSSGAVSHNYPQDQGEITTQNFSNQQKDAKVYPDVPPASEGRRIAASADASGQLSAEIEELVNDDPTSAPTKIASEVAPAQRSSTKRSPQTSRVSFEPAPEELLFSDSYASENSDAEDFPVSAAEAHRAAQSGPKSSEPSREGRQVGPEVGERPKPMPEAALGTVPQSVASAFSEIEPLDEGPIAPLQKIRVSAPVEPSSNQKVDEQGLSATRSKLLLRASSDEDSPWTAEKLQALRVEKKTVEAEWQEHMAEQDAGTLKYRAAELESRVEMHEAQILKMQKALEHADQEKARLEEDLEIAVSTASASKSLNSKDQQSLDAIKDRMRRVASSPDSQPFPATRNKEMEAALQSAYREVQALQRARAELQKQLSSIAAKINAGMIPDANELELPQIPESNGDPAHLGPEKADPGRMNTARSRQLGSFISGLSDEEIEVMNLRQENANMMDTLVRTKVELAETQGDYLKMRRALIRSVEKQATLVDRIESAKAAYGEGDFGTVERLLQLGFASLKSVGGDIQSLG